MIGDCRRQTNANDAILAAGLPEDPTGERGMPRSGIIFICLASAIMEAEQLNQLAATLSGLRDRTAGMRRYL